MRGEGKIASTTRERERKIFVAPVVKASVHSSARCRTSRGLRSAAQQPSTSHRLRVPQQSFHWCHSSELVYLSKLAVTDKQVLLGESRRECAITFNIC